MRYLEHFDSIDESARDRLVIHRHGALPGRALIVLIHGLNGSRYRTWSDDADDPTKAGLPRFLYEDFPGLDIGLYAYETALQRLKQSNQLKDEATILADRIRQQSPLYQSVILAGHSMGGLLAKAAVANLIGRPDRQTLAGIHALMLLATPQAGSLRVPKLLWRLTADARALRPHGDLITEVQRVFTNRVVAEPSPHKQDAFVIPSFVVTAAHDQWVDAFSSGLDVPDSRINRIPGSHQSAVKPRTKTDDSYEWLHDRIREVLKAAASRLAPQAPVSASDAATLGNDLVEALESAFTHEALKAQGATLGLRVDLVASNPLNTHRSLVQWAMERPMWLRAVVRAMVEARPDDARARAFADTHPQFCALLTGDEREWLRQCLASSVSNYEELSRLAFEAMVVSLDELFSQTPDKAAAAEPYVPALIRAADFFGQVETLLALVIDRFPGPVVDGKLRPLLDVVRSRRGGGSTVSSPFDACDLQGKLFINRRTFRDAFRDLTSDKGATRVVAVKGPSRSGKSHSIYYIEHVELLRKFDKVLVSLDDDTPATFTPEALIESVLSSTDGGDKAVAPISPGQQPARWISGLAKQLVSHIKTRPRPVLVVLDGFADPGLPPQTRELVKELVKQSATESRLRVALLDYDDDFLPAEVRGRMVAEPIDAFTDDDLRRFFTQFAREHGKLDPTPKAIDAIVENVRKAAPLGTAERNEEVAKAVEGWAERLRGPR